MHLVGPVGDAQGAHVRPHVRERGVLADAHGAVGLDGAVDDGERHAGHEDLGLGDLLEGGLGVAGVDLDGGVEDDEARGVDLEARARDPLDDHAVRGERLPERLLLLVVDARDHPLEGALRRADGSHGVVDAAGPEAALDDLEAAAFAEHHVVDGDLAVGEGDVAVAVGGVVVAKHAEHTLDGNARGVCGDQDDRLLLVLVWVVRGAASHGDVDLAPVIAGT